MRFATMSHENFKCIQQLFIFCCYSLHDQHVRFYARVLHSQRHTRLRNIYSFVRSTSTILRKGCSVNSKMPILLQFCAIDTHDLAKCMVAPGTAKCRFYFSFARSTRRNMVAPQNSRYRHARCYERVAFPQAFSGPRRPPPFFNQVNFSVNY